MFGVVVSGDVLGGGGAVMCGGVVCRAVLWGWVGIRVVVCGPVERGLWFVWMWFVGLWCVGVRYLGLCCLGVWLLVLWCVALLGGGGGLQSTRMWVCGVRRRGVWRPCFQGCGMRGCGVGCCGV